VGVACASGPFTTAKTPDGVVLVHRKVGYAIARPPWSTTPGWQAIDVEDADLAHRDPAGTAVSLSHRCRRTRASVSMLGRQVTIGTDRTVLHAAGPTVVGGQPGWRQQFDTIERDVTVHVEAVTVQAGDCVFDFILVSPDEEAFARLEPAFEAWVDTFTPPPDLAADAAADAAPAAPAAAGAGR
jgi:hypothetical protein